MVTGNCPPPPQLLLATRGHRVCGCVCVGGAFLLESLKKNNTLEKKHNKVVMEKQHTVHLARVGLSKELLISCQYDSHLPWGAPTSKAS